MSAGEALKGDAELWFGVADMVAASDWSDAAHVLERLPALFGDEAVTQLVMVATGALQHGERALAEQLFNVSLLVEVAREKGPAPAVEELVVRGAVKTPGVAADVTRLRVEGARLLREAAVAASTSALSSSGSDATARVLSAASAWADLGNRGEYGLLPAELLVSTAGEASPFLWLGVYAGGGTGLLDAAIRFHTLAADAADPRSADRGDGLTGLGRALAERYRRTGQIEDVDDAVVAFDEAVELVPDQGRRKDAIHDWDKAAVLHEAGNVHRDRFEARGDPADLTRAQTLHEQAIAMTDPDEPALGLFFNELGNDARLSYRNSGDEAQLRAAIDAHERALAIGGMDDWAHAQVAANLANELRDRYLETGHTGDLDRAIALHRQAIDEAAVDVPWELRHDLSLDLRARYQHNGDVSHLDEAIALVGQALSTMETDDPASAMVLMDLGVDRMDRYRRTGETPDLDGAVTAFEEAVRRTPPGSIELPTRLTNFGLALDVRHRDTGDMSALDAAVHTLRRAASLPEGQRERANTMANLGILLDRRLALTGSEDDLSEAVAALQTAHAMTGPGAPDRAWIGTALGNVLRSRYARTTRIDDLNLSCDALRDALAATEPDAPDWPDRANELSVALIELFRLDGEAAHLEEGIIGLERGLERTAAQSPGRAALQTTLAALLGARAETVAAHPDDDTRALSLMTSAVEGTPIGSPRRGLRLNNMGAVLQGQYVRTEDRSLLDAAIEAFQQAVDESAPTATDLPRFLGNLGESYRRRHATTGDGVDLEAAITAMRRGCLLALEVDLESALTTGRSWGRWAARRGSWAETAESLGYAMEAGEQAFGVQLARGEKEIWLRAIRDVPALAAFTRVSIADRDGAVAALERGRALLLSEVLELNRADLGALAEVGRDDLAVRFRAAVDRWLARRGDGAVDTVALVRE